MRKPANCCKKLHGTNKGAWSKQEDHKLIHYISTHGHGNCWRSLPSAAGLQRCGQSCRLRWINYLRPDIKRGHFDQDEEDLILKLHALLGNRWSLIAGRLPGRTDNEVKNYWNSQIRKKLIKEGIDPNNHHMHHIRSNYDHGHVRGGESNIKDGAVMSDEKSTGSSSNSDLNLDLTISVPNNNNTAASVVAVNDYKKHGADHCEPTHADLVRTTTLLLFT